MARIRAAHTLLLLSPIFLSLAAATAESFNRFISADNEFVPPEALLSGAWNKSVTLDAQQTIVAWADNLMAQGPWSVTYKSSLAPSGDKHDYCSWAPYYWPDCSKVGNKTELTPQQIWVTCPYVDRDGQFNPDFRTINDTGSFAGLCDTVFFSSLAWQITGQDKYAARAVSLINTWFIDPSTYMNPNLDYSQVVRGPGVQTGSHFGVLDLKTMTKVLTGILLFRKGNFAGWTSDIDGKMVAWAKQYINWLETSPLGQGEEATTNNHGTYFFNQMVSLQILVGNTTAAVSYLQRYFSGQYKIQINANGEQPLESIRTRPYHYRAYNLGAMITNAKLGAYVGFAAWNLTTSQGATIKTALDWAMTFNPATTGEVDSAPAPELWPHVAAVASVYGDPDGKYSSFLSSVDATYPQSPYFLVDQPLALPAGYAVTPATTAAPSTQTKSQTGGGDRRFIISATCMSVAAFGLLAILMVA